MTAAPASVTDSSLSARPEFRARRGFLRDRRRRTCHRLRRRPDSSGRRPPRGCSTRRPAARRNARCPIANPPCGGAPIRSTSSRKPNSPPPAARRIPSSSKIRFWSSGLVDPDRARPRSQSVPDEVVRPAQRRARVVLDQGLVAGPDARERVVAERPAPSVLVPFEEREVGHPEELAAALVDQLELAARGGGARPSTRATVAGSSATKSTVAPGSRPDRLDSARRRGTSRSASAPRPPRRTRGTRAPCRPTPSPAPPARRARRARAAAAQRGTGRSAPARTP